MITAKDILDKQNKSLEDYNNKFKKFNPRLANPKLEVEHIIKVISKLTDKDMFARHIQLDRFNIQYHKELLDNQVVMFDDSVRELEKLGFTVSPKDRVAPSRSTLVSCSMFVISW